MIILFNFIELEVLKRIWFFGCKNFCKCFVKLWWVLLVVIFFVFINCKLLVFLVIVFVFLKLVKINKLLIFKLCIILLICLWNKIDLFFNFFIVFNIVIWCLFGVLINKFRVVIIDFNLVL